MSITKKFNKSCNFLNNSNTFGPLISTNGNVGIGITSPGFKLDVSGNANISISLTSGALYSTNLTATNIVGTNLSSGNAMFTTSVTTASLLASTSISSASIQGTNSTITNAVYTTLSSGNVRITNSITTGSILTSSLLNTQWTPANYIINTSTTANASPLGIFAPNATSGSNISTFFGQTIGNGNVGQLNFQYYGNNNQNNNMGLSFYGGGGSAITLSNNGSVNITGTVNASAFSSVTGSYKDTLYQYALRYETANLENMGLEIDYADNILIHGLYQTQGTFYATNGSSVVVTGTGTGGTAFVSKYDNTGAFQFNLRVDGDVYDRGKKVLTDSNGYIYFAGYGATGSNTTKFYATNGSTVVSTIGNLGNHVGWFAQYDPNGGFVYNVKIDGTGSDYVMTTAIDRTQGTPDIYLGGMTTSTQCNFYVTSGATIIGTIGSFGGSQTGMIARYDNSGTFKYATRFGTVGTTISVNTITLDNSGNLYVGGQANGMFGIYNTNGTLNTTIGSIGGNNDGFVLKFNSAGSYLSTPVRIGGTNNEVINVVTTDTYGNLYVGGYTTSTQANIYEIYGLTANFTAGGTNTGFVMQYNSSGVFQTYTSITGTGNQEVIDITISNDGTPYVSGRSTSTSTQFSSIIGVMQTIGSVLGSNWTYNYNTASVMFIDGVSGYGQFTRFDSSNNIFVYGQLSAGTVGNIMDSSNQNIVGQIKAATSTNAVGYLVKYNTSNPILPQLNASYVGIGTTSPTASLDVRGRIITNNMMVSGGNLGIGMAAASYQLQLSTDSAAKPGTNTWTIASDARIKTDIELADLDVCYNNIKSIPLKRYTWRDDVYTEEEVPDRSKLGWIAQDVEVVFPKAVERINMYGYDDCRTLNSDQLLASLYGAVQKIMNTTEEQTSSIQYIQEKDSKSDLTYKGTVKLVNGQATVNIDTANQMTEGTFETQSKNPIKYLHNNDSFSKVRGIINTNILTIICEDTNSTDSIDWLIVTDRK
jgi:hypothetical protein